MSEQPTIRASSYIGFVRWTFYPGKVKAERILCGTSAFGDTYDEAYANLKSTYQDINGDKLPIKLRKKA